MQRSLIDTKGVCRRLERAGIVVSVNMLAQDRHDGYLPRLIDDPRGPRMGIGRLWEPWMVRRALYLYRLRRLGLNGDLLRVLLFLRDGQCWERVHPICLAGMRKMIDLQYSAVRRMFRHPTPTGVELYADDLAAQDGLSPEAWRFIWGAGLFGKPLPGGSLEGVFRSLHAIFPQLASGDDATLVQSSVSFGRMMETAGMTWEKALAIVADAGPQQADEARKFLRAEMLFWRHAAHAFARAQGEPMRSTNFKTLCGAPRDELTRFLRTSPGRITAAQLLAGMLGPLLVAVSAIDSGYIRIEGEGSEARAEIVIDT